MNEVGGEGDGTGRPSSPVRTTHSRTMAFAEPKLEAAVIMCPGMLSLFHTRPTILLVAWLTNVKRLRVAAVQFNLTDTAYATPDRQMPSRLNNFYLTDA